jgi:hypothetical protein
MPLYHCSQSVLKEGDIIEPGNWGKILITTGPKHNAWDREIILESIRIQYFSTKPSRLKCTFACDNLETIRFYKQVHMPTGNIYRVEHNDTSLPMHKGDFNAVQPIPTIQGDMITVALGYWEYKYKTKVKDWEHIECSEILSPSSLRVLEIIR